MSRRERLDTSFLPPALPQSVRVRQIVEATAAHFRLPIDTLLDRTQRRRRQARARQIATWIARAMTGRPYTLISRRMAELVDSQPSDHTTIRHRIRSVQARIEAGDADTLSAIHRIVERLIGG